MAAFKVDKSEALRYLGYSGQVIEEGLNERIDAIIADVEREARCGMLSRTFPLKAEPSGLSLVGSSLVLTGADIAKHLQGASECAVMACTLGLSNEAAMNRRKMASSLEGAIYSAAGSSLVECVANACEASIVADAAARGMRTNWRFSPGYGDLPLELQPEIVRVLGADTRLGISASESCFLTPTKSVTAFVGIFPAEANLDQADGLRKSCDGCDCVRSCVLLRAGSPCWRPRKPLA